MSENEISSKLLYSRDFLIRYSRLPKPDPLIAEKLLPVLNTPLGSSCTIPKRTKNPLDRKNASNPVFFQKENTLNLTHPILSKSGLDSFTTPVKKGPLVTRSVRPLFSKTPNTRKNLGSRCRI